MGRRAFFSNSDVHQLLKEFVPVADEVHWLQVSDSPEGELFRKIAEQGHYAGRKKPTSTRQGIYAAAPNGTFLASINTNDTQKLVQMLRRALARWKELDTEDRTFEQFPGAEKRKRGEFQIPENGLILKVNSRDLPRQGDPAGHRDPSWNQDFAWFTQEEARQFFEPEVGAEMQVPATFVRRLARLHLVDNVRGQTWPPYADDNVQRARLHSTVTAVEGDMVKIRFEGETRCAATGGWSNAGWEAIARRERGVETKLLGRAVYDLKKEAFVEFELVALGSRWGATRYNGRRDDLGPAPIGFVFTLASPQPAERIAPAFWARYPSQTFAAER